MALPTAGASVATINEAKAGNRAALADIFRIYHPALLRYLHARAADLADDVASQTWVSVAQSIPGFHGDGVALRGWILTIGRRRLIDELRRRSRRVEDAGEVPDLADPVTPEDVVTSKAGWAQRLVSQLPPQQADVVLMRVIGGLSVEEVAVATGLTRANVRVLSHRGLARLRALVASEAEKDTTGNPGEGVTPRGPRAM